MGQIKVKATGFVNKPKESRGFKKLLLSLFSLFLTPFILLGGLLLVIPAGFLSLYQSLSRTKEEKLLLKAQLTNSSIKNQWTYWTGGTSIRLFQKLEGEIRFGPGYFSVKSEPFVHQFEGKTFGDWFFQYKNGIFLQQWSSTKSPGTILLYFDTFNHTVTELKTNIPSVIWKMKELEKNLLLLTCDTGYEILKFEIELGINGQ